MTLALDRLRTLSRQAGKATTVARPAPATPADAGGLRSLLRLRRRPTLAVSHADRDLPGTEPAPGLRLVETLVPDVGTPEAVDVGFARRDGTLATEGLLCFDTETTGLAGGVGTRAFMIGAADRHDGGWRVRQLMITRTGAEAAMLELFASWLAPGTTLVSYNGRSYDAPLLKGRYRLARMACPITGLDHLDLLHPTRRLYKGRWENCRLATIERRALGIVREHDLPGSEAPGAWLGYLRGGSAALLREVVRHNHQDVVTLWRLLLHLAVPAINPP